MRFNLYLQRPEDSKKQAQTIRMRIRTYPSAKRSKKVCLIVTQRELSQSPKWGNSALLKCRSALQKCRIVLLDTKRSFLFGCLLDSLSRVFFLFGPCTQTYFHPQSMIFISFLDNSGFFRNNYLVDRYPKINLNKVQIIHNFIIIQSSLLFLCMQSYFKQ